MLKAVTSLLLPTDLYMHLSLPKGILYFFAKIVFFLMAKIKRQI